MGGPRDPLYRPFSGADPAGHLHLEAGKRMRLTWRGQAARLHSYFDEGKNLLERGKNILVISAALKILGLPLWMLAVIAPFLIIGYVLAGWAWVRWGWYRQQTEVSSFDRWTPIQVWSIWMQIRMLQALKVNLNSYDATQLPKEYLEIMASPRKEPLA